MLGLLNFIDFLLFVIGIALIAVPWVIRRYRGEQEPKTDYDYTDDTDEPPARRRRIPTIRTRGLRWNVALGGAILVVAVLLFVCLRGSAQVRGNEIGIVHQQLSGDYDPLQPGVRIWPLDLTLTPFFTDVEVYSTRKIRAEIGTDTPVASDSSTIGNPTVYFTYSFWGQLNPAKVEELHRRYGPDYSDELVERAATDAIKAVQGRHPYDYVAQNRTAFGLEVQTELQNKLLDIDGVPLVTITDVAIINYDYDPEIRAQLDALAQNELALQTARAQKEIAEAEQETAGIRADTDFNTRTRSAEADAQIARTNADAEAYGVTVQYEAEATGIGLVQTALAESPDGYIGYVAASNWNGELPDIVIGDASAAPFMSILPLSGTEGSVNVGDPATTEPTPTP